MNAITEHPRERPTRAAARFGSIALAGFSFMGSLAALGSYLSATPTVSAPDPVVIVMETESPERSPASHVFAR